MSAGHKMAAHRGQGEGQWRCRFADVSVIEGGVITDNVSASSPTGVCRGDAVFHTYTPQNAYLMRLPRALDSSLSRFEAEAR